MNSDSHFIQSIYETMVLLDIDPHRIVPNYRHESGEGRVILALPDSKVAIKTEGDKVQPFLDDGWFVLPLNVNQMQAFHQVFMNMMSLSFEDVTRRSMDTTKKTSQHEQWLFDAIVRRGLPAPDRNVNLKKESGGELTTPDFAWERIKVAFFVDGLWWHVSKDDHETLENLTKEEHREGILDHSRTRSEKDGEIRSEMQLRGWKVLSCTDRQLEEGFDAIEDQVDRIEQLLDQAEKEYQMMQKIRASEDKQDDSEENKGMSIKDLL